jgi:two-component system NtrC family sensor kinase
MASGSETRPGPLRDRHVLVVDDDGDIRRMIATVLESAGACVDLAASGTEAQRTIAERRHDAVLLDWHLDDMSADAFLRGAESIRPGISERVAVMTGDLIRGTEVHDAEARGFVLLRKPFRPKELIAVIQRTAGI